MEYAGALSYTVKPGNSKPVDSKLQKLENFLMPTKISIHSINHYERLKKTPGNSKDFCASQKVY